MKSFPTNRFLFLNATAKTLAVLRIFVFGLCFLYVYSTPLENLSLLPIGLFEPSGITYLAPYELLLSSGTYLYIFQLILLVLIFLSTLGVRHFNLLAITAVVGLFVFDGLVSGFSDYVSHSHFAMLYSAVILACLPAADALAFREKNCGIESRDPGCYRQGAFVIAVVFTLPYMFIGARRISQGLEIFYSDQIIRYIQVQALAPSEFGFELGLLLLGMPLAGLFLKLGFFILTLFELLSPLILVNALFRNLWLGVMVMFHFATLLTMNIFFWENMVLLLVVFLPFIYATRE